MISEWNGRAFVELKSNKRTLSHTNDASGRKKRKLFYGSGRAKTNIHFEIIVCIRFIKRIDFHYEYCISIMEIGYTIV